MITKTKFWKTIQEQLKEVERSKQFTASIMELVKEIPQDENINQGTSQPSKKRSSRSS